LSHLLIAEMSLIACIEPVGFIFSQKSSPTCFPKTFLPVKQKLKVVVV